MLNRGALDERKDLSFSWFADRHHCRKWAEVYLLHNPFTTHADSCQSSFVHGSGYAIKRAQGREDYLFAVLFLDLDR